MAREYPSPDAVSEAIIDLSARLAFPKGAEYFISDIHGIAGYTLVCSSWGLLLATHQSRTETPVDAPDVYDIHCTTEILERRSDRIRIKHTDLGREIAHRIETLTALHDAYKSGIIVQKRTKDGL